LKIRLNRTVLPLLITMAVCLILYIGAGLKFDGFFSLPILANFFTDNAVLGIAALGLTFVILSGEIDLSVGSVAALTSMIMAKLMMTAHLHPLIAIACTLLVGAVSGFIMGALVQFFKIPGFLVTLGGLFLARGLSFLLKLESIPIEHPWFSKAGDWRISLGSKFDITLPAAIFLALFLLLLCVAHYTRFGRNVYALGGNEQSATLMGLPTASTRIGVFVISGTCAALAGVVYSLYTFSGNPSAASGLELDAIAAVVIGGTLLSGGVGYLAGTVIGVLIFGIIQTAITFQGTLSSWWTKIVIGALLLLFLLIQKLIQARTLK
jgi:ribose/xylose/arabinose/galactoside ABC-type transport system permease subunit